MLEIASGIILSLILTGGFVLLLLAIPLGLALGVVGIATIPPTLRYSGGMRLWWARIVLRMTPASTIKQKAEKSARLIEHQQIVEAAIEQRAQEVHDHYLSRAAAMVTKLQQEFERYTYVQFQFSTDVIHVQVGHPEPGRSDSSFPYRIHISLYLDYPSRVKLIYVYRSRRNWEQMTQQVFAQLGAMETQLSKELREKVTHYETGTRLAQRRSATA